MLEQSAPSTSNVIRLNSFNDLRLFNPSQDWELLPPPSYYSSRGKVLDTALFYAYQKGDDHNHLLGNWLCSFMNEGEKEAMVGATKQEAICRAVICILGGLLASSTLYPIRRYNHRLNKGRGGSKA